MLRARSAGVLSFDGVINDDDDDDDTADTDEVAEVDDADVDDAVDDDDDDDDDTAISLDTAPARRSTTNCLLARGASSAMVLRATDSVHALSKLYEAPSPKLRRAMDDPKSVSSWLMLVEDANEA